MRAAILTLAFTLLVAAASAAEPTPGRWSASKTPIADAISNAAVYSQIGLDVLTAARSDAPWKALACTAARFGVATGVPMGLKAFVHRTRPDGSDDKSFPSQHTSTAVAMLPWAGSGDGGGWSVQLGVPLALVTGWGRVAAGKHHWSDVAAGAAVGLVTSRICGHLAQ